MNSAEDVSKYGNNNYYWPSTRSDVINNSFPKQLPKKDKKWSFGSLFRRKKKNDSDSSTEDENKKKKSNKPQTKTKVGFDQIVYHTNSTNNYNKRDIFSESDSKSINNFIPASEIARSSRRYKRDAVKARAEARIRDNSRGDSSEDDSPFRSDESSTSSSNRRTRAARTQRYLRRHSKDGEITNIDDLWKPHHFSGLSTIPPSHRTVISNKASSFCDYDNKNRLVISNDQRSISYDGNIHYRTPATSTEGLVLHAIGIPTNVFNYRIRAPPPPPPRDLNRTKDMQNGDTRPISFSFDHKTSSDQYLHKINPRISTHRSTSEDQLLVQPQEHMEPHRVSSSIQKPNDYRYLTDKNPRSRKPICVMQPNNSFDFWRHKDENLSAKSPVMFISKTQVKTSIYSQPENNKDLPQNMSLPKNSKMISQNILQTQTDVYNNNNVQCSTCQPARQSFSLKKEKEFCLLNNESDIGRIKVENESCKSTNLEEALDELEAIYKSLHLGDEELLDRAAERESLLENNFKPKMKVQPDPKSDDMAYRKYCKEHNNNGNDSVSTGSYLLASPVFGSSFEEFHKSSTTKEPDVTRDDVVYRNVKHTNNSLKIIEPQPPFGIPVGPILPSANSDYLHATPITYKKSKKLPDVVKDDLAFRNLRKDCNKEPALPQIHVSRQNYLGNNGYKKKRAVRSLSANIYNLMHPNEKLQIPETDNFSQNINDVADALQISREILKEKENNINATRKAFLSDGELKTSKIGNHKRNQNQLWVENKEHLYVDTKPPRSPKASTPVNINSPDEDAELEKALQHSTLEELLTSLAKETSEHITYGLNKLDESYCGLAPKNNDLKHIDSESCNEVFLPDVKPFVVETAGSVVVSPEIIEEEPDYVNIQSKDEDECTNLNLDKLQNDLHSVILNGPNKLQDDENKDCTKTGGEKCVDVTYIALPTNGYTNINKSCFEFNNLGDEASADLTDVNDTVFNELTSSLTRLVKTSMAVEINALSEVTPYTPQKSIDGCDFSFINCHNYFESKSKTFENTALADTNNDKSFTENKSDNIENTALSDINNVKSDESQTLHNNQVSTLEFKLGSFSSEQREISHINTDFDSLKSPKLVQNLTSSCCSGSRSISNSQTSTDLSISNPTWYDDPSVIAMACSCGIACTYQFPFDIITVLGLIFAIISMLLAIITRI